jgi:hypothetical protein
VLLLNIVVISLLLNEVITMVSLVRFFQKALSQYVANNGLIELDVFEFIQERLANRRPKPSPLVDLKNYSIEELKVTPMIGEIKIQKRKNLLISLARQWVFGQTELRENTFHCFFRLYDASAEIGSSGILGDKLLYVSTETFSDLNRDVILHGREHLLYLQDPKAKHIQGGGVLVETLGSAIARGIILFKAEFPEFCGSSFGTPNIATFALPKEGSAFGAYAPLYDAGVEAAKNYLKENPENTSHLLQLMKTGESIAEDQLPREGGKYYVDSVCLTSSYIHFIFELNTRVLKSMQNELIRKRNLPNLPDWEKERLSCIGVTVDNLPTNYYEMLFGMQQS